MKTKEKEVLPDVNAQDIMDQIETLESGEPRDKRSKEYREWKKMINALFIQYNEAVGFKSLHPL